MKDIFLILYKEMYFRHIYASIQVSRRFELWFYHEVILVIDTDQISFLVTLLRLVLDPCLDES